MKLSVIIVNYNVKHYVAQCVRSLYNSAKNYSIEVFIVDNASTDQSVEFLKASFPTSQYPTLHIVANGENLGFGKANNLALSKSSGEYILFINPDTIVTEDTITRCIQFLDEHPKAGAIGVKMLKPDGGFAPESRRGLPTPFTSFCKLTGLATLFPQSRRFARYYMSYLDNNQTEPIDIVSGAYMMIPHKVLNRVGGFDKDFFMYGEDIDLSYRILKAGFQNYYIPTPILHYKGESTEKSSYRYVYVFYEAMLIFFNKHYRHYSLFLSLPIKAAVYTLAAYTLLRNKANKLLSKTQHKVYPENRYLFIGNKEMIENAKLICRKFALAGDFVEGDQQTLPQGHIHLEGMEKKYRFIVYDTQSYTMSNVFNIFQQAELKTSFIGLYYPQTKTIITNRNIFNL